MGYHDANETKEVEILSLLQNKEAFSQNSMKNGYNNNRYKLFINKNNNHVKEILNNDFHLIKKITNTEANNIIGYNNNNNNRHHLFIIHIPLD